MCGMILWALGADGTTPGAGVNLGGDANFTKGVSMKEDGCGDYGFVGLHG